MVEYGRVIRNLMGTEDTAILGIRPTQQAIESTVAFASRFMRANIGEPIMLHKICQAARASERTVEYAFRGFYGMGAKKYLKLLRLNRVRDELLRAGSYGAAIQDVAWRAGFWHMGRFSSDYRRLFGERPTDTRARLRDRWH